MLFSQRLFKLEIGFRVQPSSAAQNRAGCLICNLTFAQNFVLQDHRFEKRRDWLAFLSLV